MAIPSTAVRFGGSMDPGDWRPYEMDFSPLLDVIAGEQIDLANFTLTMSAEGVALGVQMDDVGPRAPALIDSGTGIRFYLSVDPAQQNAPVFDAGVSVAITTRIRTTATPFNIFERTWVVPIVNR